MAFEMRQGVTWLIAILCSGSAGALFTQWYTNRSTVMEYSVNKTVLGSSDETTESLVPKVQIQVDAKQYQKLYIYSVKLCI